MRKFIVSLAVQICLICVHQCSIILKLIALFYTIIGSSFPLLQKKMPMNRIYTQLLYIRKTYNNGDGYNNQEVIQLPFPLTKEIQRLKSLMNELERLTPKIPDDSVKRIMEKLNF